MCEPTSISLIASAAISAVGAGVQYRNSISSSSAQAEAANRNTAEGYRVAQEGERAAAAKAFEQQTDRMREVARKTSMARVVAAEGGGSLAANAINIAAAGDEDFSRIDASLRNQKSSVRDQMAALQTGNQDALLSAQTAFKGAQIKFFGDSAASGIAAYGSYARQKSEATIRENLVSEETRKKAAFPWATGTRGFGD
ncbi:hypothetical protein [Variovorax paradoxus]|uniref:virion core protein, T7 gp14 family n=1 Tax=Variovorax paradoxus TaxID=34073 RepID=UPI001ABC700C